MWEKILQKRRRRFIMEKKSRPIRGETTNEQAEELIGRRNSNSQNFLGLQEKMLKHEKV